MNRLAHPIADGTKDRVQRPDVRAAFAHQLAVIVLVVPWTERRDGTPGKGTTVDLQIARDASCTRGSDRAAGPPRSAAWVSALGCTGVSLAWASGGMMF